MTAPDDSDVADATTPDGPAASTAAFFDRRYAAAPDRDPWNFAADEYEQSRFAALLTALPRARYRRGFEPGCAIGVLSRALATRCESLLAMDFSRVAITEAKRRAGRPNLDYRCAAFPQGLNAGDGPFDLIVCAEIGYYFSAAELVTAARALSARRAAGGDIVAQHWTGSSPDHRLSGAAVHRVLAEAWGPPSLRRPAPGYLLDVWAGSE